MATCLATSFATSAAFAQSADDDSGTPQATISAAPTNQPPPAQLEQEATPVAPPPNVPGFDGEIEEEAAADANLGYARHGVLELGASAGLTVAQDIRAVNFSPLIGYFVSDNFELSGILDVANLKAGEGNSATMWSALVEPSFHLPFDSTIFGFIGMGIGPAYVSELGGGLAVAPRIGLDFLVGRSGILRPSLSYQYTTHDAMSAANADGTTDVTLVAISSTLRFNIGYTSMW